MELVLLFPKVKSNVCQDLLWKVIRICVRAYLSAQLCLTLFKPMGCIAHQAPLSMEFSRQEYWNGLLFPTPGDLPDPGIAPASPALAGKSFTTEPPGKPIWRLVLFSHSFVSNFLRLMDCRTPGLPVHHQLPEPAQTHVHRVTDKIQPSHPLSSPSPPNFNLSQHQSLFQWVSFSHQVTKVLELQLQHQSFQWFPLGLIGWISWQSKGLSRVFSNTIVQKHQFFSAQIFYL